MANIGYPLENVYITNWKITMLLMGKLTISMAMFNSYVTNYQRVIASPTQWIGLRENLNRKPWILPSNLMGFPVKIFPSSNSMTNWLVVEPYPSEKSDFVSWDDDIPNIWKNNPHVPKHQPDMEHPPYLGPKYV